MREPKKVELSVFIGRLRNLVRYINRSELRQRAFTAAHQEDIEALLKTQLHLIKDQGIRWNSIFYMLRRAIRLQRAIRSVLP